MNTLPLSAPYNSIQDDIWEYDKLPLPKDFEHPYRKTLSFWRIKHPWLKSMAKEYILYKITNGFALGTIMNSVNCIEVFSAFLKKCNYHNLHEMTHGDIKQYIAFLNRKKRSSSFIRKNLSILGTFIQWGAWTHPELFPTGPVIHTEDFPKEIRREPRYYSENEIAQIKSVLPHANKVFARITLVMLHCGLRFSDVARLTITVADHSCLTETNGYPVLEYYMPKVKRYNRIPIPGIIAKIIQVQINETQRKFGKNCPYVFAKSANEQYQTLLYRIHMNRLFKNHRLKTDDGQQLKIHTRMFRKTYATNLLNCGVAPETVRAMLGHKNINTQRHYATIHGDTMLSLLAPLTHQDNELIAKIGKITTGMCYVPDDYSDFIPLPNGACLCAGDCSHQNACYTCSFYHPQKEFLSTYKLQLEQAELAIAEAKKYNHTAFMQKNIMLRDALKAIIDKLEVIALETG